MDSPRPPQHGYLPVAFDLTKGIRLADDALAMKNA
jgi:hypothetical protein